MALREAVINYLNENARREGVEAPRPGDDLFETGVLDSFALVDFASILEEQYGFKIPDSDVNRDNFRTMEAVEDYVNARRG